MLAHQSNQKKKEITKFCRIINMRGDIMHNHINNFYLEFKDYIDNNKKLEIKEKYNYLFK